MFLGNKVLFTKVEIDNIIKLLIKSIEYTNSTTILNTLSLILVDFVVYNKTLTRKQFQHIQRIVNKLPDEADVSLNMISEKGKYYRKAYSPSISRKEKLDGIKSLKIAKSKAMENYVFEYWTLNDRTNSIIAKIRSSGISPFVIQDLIDYLKEYNLYEETLDVEVRVGELKVVGFS